MRKGSCAQGPARISRCWLDKEFLECGVAQNFGIGDTIQCNSAGHAKVFAIADPMQVSGLLNQDFLKRRLQASGDIHMKWLYLRLPLPRGMAEQLQQSL